MSRRREQLFKLAGAIDRWPGQTGDLQPFEEALVERLVGEPLVHLDESGVRVSSKLHWLHVALHPSINLL